MREQKGVLNNQKGVATTEFVVVSFIFILFLAAFNFVGEVVLLKIKSLIEVRNLAFHESEAPDSLIGDFKRQTILTTQTPTAALDKCLSPYLIMKPSRVKAQVTLKPDAFFKEWGSFPVFSEQFLITEDSWKNLPSLILGGLASRCSG